MARSIRVDVSRDVLEWAVDKSEKRVQLEQQLPMLNRWLDGEVKPTLRQLEDLAKKTYVPLGVLFLPDPPTEELAIPNYRTFGDDVLAEPSRNLLDTVQIMMARQTWLREYLIEDGFGPKSFVGAASVTDDAWEVADSIRSALGLSVDWADSTSTWEDALVKIFRSAEQAGIMVVRNGVVGNNTRRKLDTMEFRGFVLVDEYAPLIFINGADYKAAQMFTLAHELAHLWLGRSAVFDLAFLQPADHAIERGCNRIAGEFLVPTETLHGDLPQRLRKSDHATVWRDMARRYKVSPLVIARRALDTGMISHDAYRTYYHSYLDGMRKRQLRRERDDEGGDFYHNQNYRVGRLFFTHVANAVKESNLLYREAYRLTGLPGDTFAEYAKRQLGGIWESEVGLHIS